MDIKKESSRENTIEIFLKRMVEIISHLQSAGFSGAEAIIRAYFLKWIQEKILIPVTEERDLFLKKTHWL